MRSIVAVAVAVVVVVVVAIGLLLVLHQGDSGVAWTYPADQRLVLAQGETAVTTADDGGKLVARAADSGQQRWTFDLGSAEIVTVQAVGRTLLATSEDNLVRAIDLDSGKLRWSEPADDPALPVVASPTTVAITTCQGKECAVQARALDTGEVVWSARTSSRGAYLGAPTTSRQFPAQLSQLWPARYVIVADPDEMNPAYAVRALDSGQTVLRDEIGDEEQVVIVGNQLVRAGTDTERHTPLVATDLDTQRTAWQLPQPASAAIGTEDPPYTIAIVDGSIVLFPRFSLMPRGKIARDGRLQTVDPATGRVRTTDVGFPGATAILIEDAVGPVTERSAGRAPAARVPVMLAYQDDKPTLVSGDLRETDFDSASVVTTSTRVAYLEGDDHAIVRDRTSGDVVGEAHGDDLEVTAIGDVVVARGDDTVRVFTP